MTNELVKKEHAPYTVIERMGTTIAKSGLFGVKTAEQAIALMLVAQAQGRHPATVAMEYDIIQNKPALKSQAALMRFQEAGGKIQYIKRTDEEVSAEFSHPAGGTVVVTWTLERARKMGFLEKDNWKKQPMIMLQWRVVAEGVRACYPACLGGSYLVEEVQDFEPHGKAAEVKGRFMPTPIEDVPVFTPPPTTSELMDAALPITEADVEGGKEEGVKGEGVMAGDIIQFVPAAAKGKPHKIKIKDTILTTFSDSDAKIIKEAVDTGNEVIVEFTVNGKYNNITKLILNRPELRDWQKEFEEAPDSSYLDELWTEFEATKPNGVMTVKMRRISDRKRSEWKEGK